MRRVTWFNATSLTLGFAFLYLPMVILIIYSFNRSKFTSLVCYIKRFYTLTSAVCCSVIFNGRSFTVSFFRNNKDIIVITFFYTNHTNKLVLFIC